MRPILSLSQPRPAIPGSLVPPIGPVLNVNQPGAAVAADTFGDGVPVKPAVSVPNAAPIAPSPAPTIRDGRLASMLYKTLNGEAAAQPHGVAGFFERVFHPTNALGQFGQALLMAGGDPGRALALVDERDRQTEAQRLARAKEMVQAGRYDQEHADKMDERQWQRTKPEYWSGNEDRLKFDPTTGQVVTVYDAPTDAQDYAASLGLDTETDAGRRAVQDYVLRGSGPTALESDLRLEEARYGHRAALKGSPTYRQAHPLPGSLGGRRSRKPSSRSPRVREGATATGPGGKKVIYRNGKWVDLR